MRCAVSFLLVLSFGLPSCLAKKKKNDDLYYTTTTNYSSRKKKCEDKGDIWRVDHCVEKTSGKTYAEICLAQGKKWDPANSECLEEASGFVLQAGYKTQKDCEAKSFTWQDGLCLQKQP